MANDSDRNRIPELWDSIDQFVPDEHLAEFRQLALELHDLYTAEHTTKYLKGFTEGFQYGQAGPFRDCRKSSLGNPARGQPRPLVN